MTTMTDAGETGRFAAEIVVYGSSTCEDTAITLSRLGALGVPFRDVDIDADPAGLARAIDLVGRRVTPTVVLEGSADAITEPAMAELEALVRVAGHPFERPLARQIQGTLAERPIPLRTVPSGGKPPFSLQGLRGRWQSAVLFAHGAGCLACFGYAKQLAHEADRLRIAESLPIVVVRDTPGAAAGWLDEIGGGITLLADPLGEWTRDVARTMNADADGVMLLVLDRYVAPRAASLAGEAGGLISPEDAAEWLEFLTLECPGCGNDVASPER